MGTCIIISINVHENLPFLEKQISNIHTHLKIPHKIILNCSVAFYKEIEERKVFHKNDDVFLNPKPIDKKRYHGSLLHGIYSNLSFARAHFAFDYFLVLSSRTFFYKEFDVSNLHELPKRDSFRTCQKITKSNKKRRFGSFLQTKLAKYMIDNRKERFVAGAHEGLFFDRINCESICNFMEKKETIRKELFQWKWCVEEFALQTICMFKNKYYYYIGTGLQTYRLEDVPNDEKHRHTYVCKIERK